MNLNSKFLSKFKYGMTDKEKFSHPLDCIYSQFIGKQEKTNTEHKTTYTWKQITEESLSDYTGSLKKILF